MKQGVPVPFKTRVRVTREHLQWSSPDDPGEHPLAEALHCQFHRWFEFGEAPEEIVDPATGVAWAVGDRLRHWLERFERGKPVPPITVRFGRREDGLHVVESDPWHYPVVEAEETEGERRVSHLDKSRPAR